jgi:O-antigen/teichoic acid export membrane protein
MNILPAALKSEKFRFGNLVKNRKLRQVSSLYASIVINFTFGFVTSVLTANMLGGNLLGDYKLLQNTWQLALLIFNFGFFPALNLYIAETNDDQKRKKIYGLGFLGTFLLFILLDVCLFLVSFFYKFNGSTDVNSLLRITLPLISGLFFQALFENCFSGDNRIRDLSLLRTIAPISFFIGIIALRYFKHGSLINILLVQQIPLILLAVYFHYKIKPDYTGLSKLLGDVNKLVKRHGFHIYIGALIGVGSQNVVSILISEFLKVKELGYYSLSIAITTPIILLPGVVGTTFLKDFVTLDRIPAKVLKSTLAINIVSFGLFFACISPLIRVLYKPEFWVIVPYTYVVVCGSFFHGFGDLYNRFLLAKGMGKKLRQIALYTGISSIVVFLVFVKMLGIWGALISRLISDGIYLSGTLYYYYWFIKKKKVENGTE